MEIWIPSDRLSQPFHHIAGDLVFYKEKVVKIKEEGGNIPAFFLSLTKCDKNLNFC